MNLKLKNNQNLKLSSLTALEYIESTGKEYIDTGMSFPNGFRIVTTITRTNTDLTYSQFIGSHGGSQNHNCARIGSNRWESCGGQTVRSAGTVTRDTVYNIDISNANNKAIIKVDGSTLIDSTLTGSYTDLNVWLFNVNNNTSYPFKGRLGRTKIYDSNDALRLDLIPCKDPNNVACMYDDISGNLFYNQGTGNFIAGPESSEIILPLKHRITTVYIENCPNINGYSILKEYTNLQRVRLDIESVSGSFDELMSYSSLGGFNDSYEPQTKPRLVGTWTINDWYLPEQLTTAQAAFDGLTVQGDPNYIINFNDIAVQTLDNTKPNYNPAVAIILQSVGYGNTFYSPIISGQDGRYFITKSDVANIPFSTRNTLGTLFNNTRSVVSDTNKIVNQNGSSYTLTSFNEFQYFTSINILGNTTANGNFMCTSLRYFTTPGTITHFGEYSNRSNKNNNQVVYIQENFLPSYIHRHNGYDGFINSAKTGNRYILSCRKDKYSVCNLYEQYIDYLGTIGYQSQIRTYYTYCAPKISYNGTDVSITVERESEIFYTLDGTTPTIQSNHYTEPFSWDGTGVIKAMAIDTTNIVGDIAYSDDFYALTTQTPTISINTNREIVIESESGATIYYTIDGTYPTLESSVYSSPIQDSEDIIKVRCFAVHEGKNDSEVTGKICVLNENLWGTSGDTSYFAVQSIDSTKPNYNPAVCIILYSNEVISDYIPGYGGYFTKTDASNVTTLSSSVGGVRESWFSGKTTVGNNFILPNSYTFTSFNEFKYFTNYSFENYTGSNKGFAQSCTLLEEITLPNSATNITLQSFYGCSKLKHIRNFSIVTTIGQNAFRSCKLLELDSISNVTSIGPGAFYDCNKITITEINSQVTSINESSTASGTFRGTTSIPYLHVLSNTPISGLLNYPRTNVGSTFFGTTYKIYVGSGYSFSNDNTILEAYTTDNVWQSYSSDLDTWYNFITPRITTNDLTVTIENDCGEPIYYTLDGTEPTTSSSLYSGPFTLPEDGKIIAKTIGQNIISISITKYTNTYKIVYSVPSNNYQTTLFYNNLSNIQYTTVDGIETTLSSNRLNFNKGLHTVEYVFNTETTPFDFLTAGSDSTIKEIYVPSRFTDSGRFPVTLSVMDTLIIEENCNINTYGCNIPNLKELIIPPGATMGGFMNGGAGRYNVGGGELIITIKSDNITGRGALSSGAVFLSVLYDDAVTVYYILVNENGMYNTYQIGEGFSGFTEALQFGRAKIIKSFIFNKTTKIQAPPNPASYFPYSELGTIYVGKGVDQTSDNALLAQYMSDPGWSSYTFDTHYNFNHIVGDTEVTNSGNVVTFWNRTQGCSMYYTIDGSNPTTSSTLYTGSITITQNTTFKVLATKEGMINSGIVVKQITI